MKKFENRLLEAIVFGIVAGTLCAVLDLIPGDNIWTFSQKNNMVGIIALSLPIGLLVYEFISLLLSVMINHKYLFQTIVDVIGIIILWKEV